MLTSNAMHSQEMVAGGTRKEDCGAPIGKRLSSMHLCAGPDEMAFGVGVFVARYRLNRRNQVKAEVRGVKRGSSSPHVFYSFT
jgi:hypothetical protein